MAKKVIVTVAPPSGDPTKNGDAREIPIANREPIARRLDVRDQLAELVGRGNSIGLKDKNGIFQALAGQFGQDKAAKIMNHAFLFNQRPDVLKLPLEDKLKSFYEIGSNDNDVNQIIAKSKSLGYGVLPGFRNSSSAINQELSGLIPSSTAAVPDSIGTKKVIIRTTK
jgi:hypothetical protein